MSLKWINQQLDPIRKRLIIENAFIYQLTMERYLINHQVPYLETLTRYVKKYSRNRESSKSISTVLSKVVHDTIHVLISMQENRGSICFNMPIFIMQKERFCALHRQYENIFSNNESIITYYGSIPQAQSCIDFGSNMTLENEFFTFLISVYILISLFSTEHRHNEQC